MNGVCRLPRYLGMKQCAYVVTSLWFSDHLEMECMIIEASTSKRGPEMLGGVGPYKLATNPFHN